MIGMPACVPAQPVTPMPIDLLRELPRADRAPAADAHRLISVEVIDRDGSARPALVMRATSRVIWHVQMTKPAEFRTGIGRVPGDLPGADLSVRLGVSDGRLYEDLYWEQVPASDDEVSAWAPIALDLSRYSGWKWSVFHQPARRTWLLILNVQGDGAVALVEPAIVDR